MNRRTGCLRALTIVVAGSSLYAATCPSVAAAHGPVAPIASSYEARVTQLPARVEAKVIDGDQRMWLHVSSGRTVVVLDYRGAPYLRFSGSGVAVNHNSAMYYLNQTPAELPPPNLRPNTPPRWLSVTAAHDYSWHDGRLHALATVALPPGVSYVGKWSIPLRLDRQVGAVSGGLWHAADPSIVWFWPIVVLVACTLALWRLRRPELDVTAARGLGVAALLAIACAAVGRDLHGRPSVSTLQLIAFVLIASFVVWASRQLLLRKTGYFAYFAVAFVSIYEGAQLVPTLLNGYVLAAIPAFATRATAVVCLGCGVGLLLLVFRLAERAEANLTDTEELEAEDAAISESFT